VVWFGEPLPEDALDGAFRAASMADLALSVGTSALVEPAASVPRIAVANGARLIEVNPDPTPLSGMAVVVLRAPAARALPALLARNPDP
jgi:NAD-dependent deacetylase